MRGASLIACLALVGGCFSDESGLVNGAGLDMVGAVADGGGGADPDAGTDASSQPDLLPADDCDDFSADAVGGSAAGWTTVGGSFSVVATGAAHALAQGTAYLAPDDFYAATHGTNPPADVTVTGTLLAAGAPGRECVMARFKDLDNFYGACLRDGNKWELVRVLDGNAVSLGTGAVTYAAGSMHVVELRVHGTTIGLSIDGTAQPDASDATFDHGAVGVVTETTTKYLRVCERP